MGSRKKFFWVCLCRCDCLQRILGMLLLFYYYTNRILYKYSHADPALHCFDIIFPVRYSTHPMIKTQNTEQRIFYVHSASFFFFHSLISPPKDPFCFRNHPAGVSPSNKRSSFLHNKKVTSSFLPSSSFVLLSLLHLLNKSVTLQQLIKPKSSFHRRRQHTTAKNRQLLSSINHQSIINLSWVYSVVSVRRNKLSMWNLIWKPRRR